MGLEFPGGPVVKNPSANAGDLVREDSTGHGASKLVRSHCRRPCSVTRKAITMRSLSTATREQAMCNNRDPEQQEQINF